MHVLVLIPILFAGRFLYLQCIGNAFLESANLQPGHVEVRSNALEQTSRPGIVNRVGYENKEDFTIVVDDQTVGWNKRQPTIV